MTTEEWRWLPGWERRYEVSDEGRVRSHFHAKGVRSEPILFDPWVDEHGYRQITLSRRGQRRKMFLHNAVLLAFVGPRPADCPHTRHLDGDPTNNTLHNLAYGTAAENAADRVLHGTNPWSRRTHCGAGHPLTGDNLLMRGDSGRRCRTCSSAYHKARRRRAAQARAA